MISRALKKLRSRRLMTWQVYLAITVIGVIALAITWISAPNKQQTIASSLSGLFSSFLGAYLAFRLSKEKQKEDEDEKRVIALHLAIFTLNRQMNAMLQYWRLISAYRDEPTAFLKLQANRLPDYSSLKQDFKSLTFLLETDAQIVYDLSIQEERFFQSTFSIEKHADFHRSEYQKAAGEIEIRASEITLEDLRKLLGERILETLKTQTGEIFKHVPRTVKTHYDLSKRLYERARLLYPETKFVRLEFDLAKENVV